MTDEKAFRWEEFLSGALFWLLKFECEWRFIWN